MSAQPKPHPNTGNTHNRKNPDATMTTILAVRMLQEDKDILQQYAEKKGKPMSDLVSPALEYLVKLARKEMEQ